MVELVQNVARNSGRVLRAKTRDPNLEGDPGRQIWIWGSSFKFFGRPGRENLSARRPELTSLLLLLTFAPFGFFLKALRSRFTILIRFCVWYQIRPAVIQHKSKFQKRNHW